MVNGGLNFSLGWASAWRLSLGTSGNCELRLAEKAIAHAFLVGIPVPVILIGILFDSPKLIDQRRIGNRELKPVAQKGVRPFRECQKGLQSYKKFVILDDLLSHVGGRAVIQQSDTTHAKQLLDG